MFSAITEYGNLEQSREKADRTTTNKKAHYQLYYLRVYFILSNLWSASSGTRSSTKAHDLTLMLAPAIYSINTST